MNAAAPADTALWDLEDIEEPLDAEAFEDPEMTPDPEHLAAPEAETGATSSAATPKFRIFQKSRPSGEKPDAKILKQALDKWHDRIETEDDEQATSSTAGWPTLPEATLGLDQLRPHPLCKGDVRANSTGPLARVPRIRVNRTARTVSPSSAPHIEPGWEAAPGIPKSGFFLELLARVRKNEQEQPVRQQQAF